MAPFTIDPQMCRTCGGRCCQGHPGLWVEPARLAALYFDGTLPSRERLAELLPPFGFFLKDLCGVAVPAPVADEKGCTFLTADGCRLPASHRPCQCLALTPSIDTLMEGEICCSLPPPFRSGNVMESWRHFWDEHSQ